MTMCGCAKLPIRASCFYVSTALSNVRSYEKAGDTKIYFVRRGSIPMLFLVLDLPVAITQTGAQHQDPLYDLQPSSPLLGCASHRGSCPLIRR